MARLAVAGLSHRTAPVDVRERAAIPDGELASVLTRARATAGVDEVMIVSTCNRVEIYGAVADDAGADLLRGVLCDMRGADLRGAVYGYEGEAALRHVFRVASSLDSMVVGEPQILGQVKDAYSAAVEQGVAGALLGRVLPRAFQIAKRVRSETEIARASASVASVAVDLARQIFGELDGRRVLVVGAGKMGALAARHLKKAGAADLTVVNRTASRGAELADQLGAQAAPWEERETLLRVADIVVSSTGASEPVLTRAIVERAMKARRGRWLLLIDIAVPRDIEPTAGKLENVFLYDIDGLQQVLDANLAGRMREADQAAALVEEEVRRFLAGEQALGVVPTIKDLRAHFVAVAQAEVARLQQRMSAGANERDRALIKELGDALVNKLLHGPLTALKADGGDELAKATRALFKLDETVAEEVEAEQPEPQKKKA
jgi:glutamyl-tRNA reductase